MKSSLLYLVVMLVVTSCAYHGKQAVYEMMHERERQECLKQGRFDCPKAESYDTYKLQRDEILKPENSDNIK